jgi:hypothetical protein
MSSGAAKTRRRESRRGRLKTRSTPVQFHVEMYLGMLNMQKADSPQGSLYPALHRMEEAGWMRAKWIITKHSGRRARVYELSASGKKQVAAEESRWQISTSALNRALRNA